MLNVCRLCHYLFESETKVERCPDCGKFAVRLATLEEKKEYEQRESGKDNENRCGK